MATGMGSYEEAVAPFKFKLLQNISRDKPGQRVLEVGIGAAPNLRYLLNPTLPQVHNNDLIFNNILSAEPDGAMA